MEKIYSKINKNKLLHIINRCTEIVNRTEIIESNNFLQCATLRMDKNKTFKPHKHIFKKINFDEIIAQESWIVISGRVKCTFYDIDDTKIEEIILYPGDASFTLYGGHTYEILENNTIVYEYKSGPYFGIELDKKFINE